MRRAWRGGVRQAAARYALPAVGGGNRPTLRAHMRARWPANLLRMSARSPDSGRALAMQIEAYWPAVASDHAQDVARHRAQHAPRLARRSAAGCRTLCAAGGRRCAAAVRSDFRQRCDGYFSSSITAYIMSSIKNPLAAILDSNKFTGLNYQDWLRNLNIVLASEKLIYTIEKSPPKEAPADISPEELVTLKQWWDDELKTRCYVMASMLE
ncbi:hypothetical protein F511_35688 [Dorcoceras hygrometricum]|uniref:Uncharacterized protein n=1 Tax=Dorcoceras hygrometricum TaxID=472368 RepID=A0A2Z7AS10_9LAMI|nr:hypothetical protein F511_35688 [Dorcoceras hygrometricum]